MTRDDILQLVEEAGFELYMFSSKGRDSFERFANLVAAQERKACEQACIDLKYDGDWSDCAEAIRARGEK